MHSSVCAPCSRVPLLVLPARIFSSNKNEKNALLNMFAQHLVASLTPNLFVQQTCGWVLLTELFPHLIFTHTEVCIIVYCLLSGKTVLSSCSFASSVFPCGRRHFSWNFWIGGTEEIQQVTSDTFLEHLHVKLKLFLVAWHLTCRCHANAGFEMTNKFVAGGEEDRTKIHYSVDQYFPIFRSSFYQRIPKANFRQDRYRAALSLMAVENCLLHLSSNSWLHLEKSL